MFKIFLNTPKKTSFFLIFFFFIIYNGLQIYAYPLNDSSSRYVKNSQLSTLNPYDYEIDYNKKHNSQFWRHENGHTFSDNARVFYDIPDIKMVPCRTYQEYANTKQITSNVVGIGLNFIPIVKPCYGIMNFWLKEKLVDDKDDQVAMINDIVRYYALNDQSKVFFFFEPHQLNEIKQIDITFCDCDMSSSLITSISDFINHLTDFLDTADFNKFAENLLLKGEFSNEELLEMNIEVNNLSKKIITKEAINEVKKIIRKKINQKVGHAITKAAIKKGTKKIVGSLWGKIFFPEVLEAMEIAEKKYDSSSYKKENIVFDIQNNSYEKTLGFFLYFPSQNELEVYKLQNFNDNYIYTLVKRVNFSNSTHMLINLIQPKNGIQKQPQTNLNVYCGKLKK